MNIMSKKIITVHTDGTVSALRYKDGPDLSVMGRQAIKRASDIVWLEDRQKWAVKPLLGPLKGLVTKEQVMRATRGENVPVNSRGDVAVFDTYEDAVQAEIVVLDALRLQGHPITAG